MRIFNTILFFILTISFANQVHAECAYYGFDVWPKSDTLSRDPIIIIDGLDNSQEVIEKLDKNYRFFLKSTTEKVDLKVIEMNVGGFRLSQSILKPISSLKIGDKYSLKVEELPSTHREDRSISEDHLNEALEKMWEVTDTIDTTPPNWIIKPKYLKPSAKRFGCGPAIFSIFEAKVEDESEVIIEAKLRLLKEPDKEMKCLVKYKNGKIKIGHGMCSGAFKLELNEKYEVRFKAMDSSGNISDSNVNINFTSPTINHFLKPKDLKPKP